MGTSAENLRKVLHRIQIDTTHFHPKTRVNRGFRGLSRSVNRTAVTRDDEYGGESIQNRLRFVLETVDAVSEAIGSSRVAIRISPEARIHDGPTYPSERETFLILAEELSRRNLSYLHINDMGVSPETLAAIRRIYRGTLMIAGEYTREKAQKVIGSGLVDLVAFGRPYIANPDLIERFHNGWPLAVAEHAVFYGGDDRGYTDFPSYAEVRLLDEHVGTNPACRSNDG